MDTCLISDVHAKPQHRQILQKFLEHPKVLESQQIIFLGDIFDLMVGPYVEYMQKYSFFFDWLKKASAEKSVYYFEGNHDFHLGRLFKNHLPEVKYIKGHLIQELFGKRYYFSHGDDIEIGNPSYKIYKELVNNPVMEWVSAKVFNFSMVDMIGNRASQASRAYNSDKYSSSISLGPVQENFRKAAEQTRLLFQVDRVVCGHSHIREEGPHYFNNGYCPATQCFTHISAQGIFLTAL